MMEKTIQLIVDFLSDIGLAVKGHELLDDIFLPSISVK